MEGGREGGREGEREMTSTFQPGVGSGKGDTHTPLTPPPPPR